MDPLSLRLRHGAVTLACTVACTVAALLPRASALASPVSDQAAPERAELAYHALGVPKRWQPHIEEASRRFGVPADWIARVMIAESGGRAELGGRPITSHAGAMGLMQLMPGTWSEMRRRLGLGGDPHDPRDNILAGTLYLRMMHDRFGYPGVFGAYNAGPARYAAYLGGRQSLPAETRAYIRKVAGVSRRGIARADAILPVMAPRRPSPGDRSAASVGVARDPQSGEMSDLFFIRR